MAAQHEEITREVLDAILQVVEGGDPEEIASDVGLEAQHLQAMADAFVKEGYREALLGEAARRKIGRNEPCPCGSGKKYKKCCLARHERARALLRGTQARDFQPKKPEESLPEHAVKGFDLLAAARYEDAIAHALTLLQSYPEDDRLHDTLASAYLAVGKLPEAEEICRARWQVAKEEKAFFINHGYHRRQPVPDAPAHFYAPETWLEKYWIADRAGHYRNLLPNPPDSRLSSLVEELLTANDLQKFPEQQQEGLERRREALAPTIQHLRAAGAEAIPYLLQIVSRYSWATFFVPELLASYATELATRSLVDLSMFGYHYVSEACLKHLEEMGEGALPFIREAFSRDRTFDPLKVGVITMIGKMPQPAVDDLLEELLQSKEPAVVDWAALALGRRERLDLLEALEEARERIGDKPRISWAIGQLQKLDTGR